MRKTTTHTAELLREIGRLYGRSQRILVHFCNATSTQTHVLLELAQRGPMALGELGIRLELGKSWTGRVVQRLVNAGAVTRVRDPHDARRRIVELTPLGRHRVMYLRSELDHHAARILNCRRESARRSLNHELSELVSSLRRHDDIRDRRPIPGQAYYPVFPAAARNEAWLI